MVLVSIVVVETTSPMMTHYLNLQYIIVRPMGRDHTIFITLQSQSIKVKMMIVPPPRKKKKSGRKPSQCAFLQEQWAKLIACNFTYATSYIIYNRLDLLKSTHLKNSKFTWKGKHFRRLFVVMEWITDKQIKYQVWVDMKDITAGDCRDKKRDSCINGQQ